MSSHDLTLDDAMLQGYNADGSAAPAQMGQNMVQPGE